MKKKIPNFLFFLSIFFVGKIVAQTPEAVNFTFEAKFPIPDWSEGEYNPLILPLTMNGLPERIDSSYGLHKIILTIRHNYISDVKVDLISPDGTDIWITNRNGRDGKDYIEATFSQNGFNGLITENKAPFTGEYIPDGLLEKFNNGQNPNGVWRLLIHDLNTGVEGVFEKITFIFDDKPAVTKNAPCTLTKLANCKCSSDSLKWKLLPDLTISARNTLNNVWEIPFNPALGYGGIKFEVRTLNVGLGPLEIEGTGIFLCGNDTVPPGTRCSGDEPPRQIFKQNIYVLKPDKKELTKIAKGAGLIIYDDRAGHNHFHANDYCSYTLLEKVENEPNPDKWRIVGSSSKASFCLWDMQFCSEPLGNCDDTKGKFFTEHNLPNYGLGTYKTCFDGTKQGLAVGGVDYYGLHYEGQTIRIPKGTCNGTYYLRIVLDPSNRFEESDKTNNDLLVPVRLMTQSACEGK